MKLRNLIQESPPKAQKKQGVFFVECMSVSLDQNIGGFGLKWPPI